MKKFDHQLTLDELTELCVTKGWTMDTRKHDLEGSDFVTFYWKHGGRTTPVVYCPFNGNFIVGRGGKVFTERSEADGTPWFDALLKTIYVSNEAVS